MVESLGKKALKFSKHWEFQCLTDFFEIHPDLIKSMIADDQNLAWNFISVDIWLSLYHLQYDINQLIEDIDLVESRYCAEPA